MKKAILDYRVMKVVEIAECTFADDLAVFVRKQKELQLESMV